MNEQNLLLNIGKGSLGLFSNIYVVDVFNDNITIYESKQSNLNKKESLSLTSYLNDISNKISPEYLSLYTNLFSIPKLKEEIKNGNELFLLQYKTLNGLSKLGASKIINIDNKDIIIVFEQDIVIKNDNNSSNLKFNSLVESLSDAILKVTNAFNVNEKTNIKNIEGYVNSILFGLSNNYPELKNGLTKNVLTTTASSNDVILVVDDDLVTRNMIKKVFNDEYQMVMVTNGKEAIDYLKENDNKALTGSNDNVLGIFLDLTMPVMDGFSVLEYLSKNNYLSKVPVIIISGDYEKETKNRVYSYNIADMLEKPFDFDVVRHRISNFINLYRSSNSLNKLISDQNSDLKDLIILLAENYKYDYSKNITSINLYMKILLNRVVEDYLEYSNYLVDIDKIAEASMYYDLGLYYVPRTILTKNNNFTKEELEKLKSYPILGSKMLKSVLSLNDDEKYKKYAYNITKCYHENYDGTGYPNGLKGDNIPFEAQVASICIIYNNLSKKSHEHAREFIISKKGVMFNPKLVDSFIKAQDDFLGLNKEVQ